MKMNWAGLALAVLIMGSSLGASAQQGVPALDAIKNQQELTVAVTELDRQIFDAVNTCEITKLGSLVADDLEFYHDRTGLATGKQAFLDAVKNNLCGKVQRKLVEGTLEAHPLHGYGAVEIGVHRFYHPYTQDHGVIGEAKFIHLWQYKDGSWKLTRVISYDHAPAN